MALWDDVLTEQDRRVIANAGYGRTRGFGTSPVLMIIDCQYNYIGDDMPVDEQQKNWPAGGGENAWIAVRHIANLIAKARSTNIPIIYTRNVQKRTILFDSFRAKSTWDKSSSFDDADGSRIVSELEPEPGDLLIDKSYASAFFGTPLITYLVGLGADTIIMTGVSTSGCVRATAVDGVTQGFNVAVVADAVADRIEVSHKASLLDLWMKYTDVVECTVIERYFAEWKDPKICLNV